MTISEEKSRIEWWPIGIAIFFSLAISGVVVFVIFCNLHPTELVTGDYYEQELKYQDQMDRVERTRRLGSAVTLKYDAIARHITFQVPSSQARQGVDGEIQFYRPSSAGMDHRLKVAVDGEGRQQIDLGALDRGLWKVRIIWTVGSEQFLVDESVVVGTRTNS